MKGISGHQTLAERFELQYIPEPNSGCWLWTGPMTSSGYGLTSDKGKRIGAHCASVLLDGRVIPSGMDVCHKCDTRLCVNPRHLFVGTRKENWDDCVSKKRHSHGERNYNTKLDAVDVIAIRQSSLKPKEIAKQFGITRRYAQAVRDGRTWKHL